MKEFVHAFNREPLAPTGAGVGRALDSIMSTLINYEPNPEWAKEDPRYFGDEKVEIVIQESLDRLRALGVRVSDP